MELRLLEPAIDELQYYWLIGIGSELAGTHAELGWCTRSNERVVSLDSEGIFTLLWPLLELQPDDFYDFLNRAAIANPAHGQMIFAFPITLLLKQVFHESFSGYWPDRALAWLKTDQTSWPAFREELGAFTKNKVMPQLARQQAQKMLRTLEAS